MITVIILAGGKGTRVQSDLPKVLLPIHGTPILVRLLDGLRPVCARPIVVVGYKAEEVIEATGRACEYVFQREQLGTGHALQCVKSHLAGREGKEVVVLPGDHPFVTGATITRLIEAHHRMRPAVTMATVVVSHFEAEYAIFYHFGRVVRDAHGAVRDIVEFKEARNEQKDIKEVNLSYYCFDVPWLWENIDHLKNENRAREYYLTDMIRIAFTQGRMVYGVRIENPVEGMGVNTVEELHIAEKYTR